MKDPIPVFIIHWNRPEQCCKAVYSFLNQSYPCRIVVIDNGSKLEFREILLNSFSSITEVSFIWNERNLGFAGAIAPVIHEWVKNAKEPACIVAAHDVDAEPKAVEKLMEVLLSEPKIGIAFPIHDHPGKNFWEPTKGLWNPIKGARLVPMLESEYENRKVVYSTWFQEHCTAIKREVLLRGINFDPRLFAYYEGADLSLSAKNQGYDSVLVTDAIVHNTEWGGSVEGGLLFVYLLSRNSVLMAYKHSGRVAAALRAMYIVAASVKNWITGAGMQRQFNSRVRIRGVIDAIRGRYGPPPDDLLNWS